MSQHNVRRIQSVDGNDVGIVTRPCQSIADLEEIDLSTLSDGDSVVVKSFYSNLDGGGDTFIWDADGNEDTHNGGTIIAPSKLSEHTGTAVDSTWWTAPASVTTGVWKRIYSGAVNVKWFGVKGDGSDDTLAFEAVGLERSVAQGGEDDSYITPQSKNDRTDYTQNPISYAIPVRNNLSIKGGILKAFGAITSYWSWGVFGVPNSTEVSDISIEDIEIDSNDTSLFKAGIIDKFRRFKISGIRLLNKAGGSIANGFRMGRGDTPTENNRALLVTNNIYTDTGTANSGYNVTGFVINSNIIEDTSGEALDKGGELWDGQATCDLGSVTGNSVYGNSGDAPIEINAGDYVAVGSNAIKTSDVHGVLVNSKLTPPYASSGQAWEGNRGLAISGNAIDNNNTDSPGRQAIGLSKGSGDTARDVDVNVITTISGNALDIARSADNVGISSNSTSSVVAANAIGGGAAGILYGNSLLRSKYAVIGHNAILNAYTTGADGVQTGGIVSDKAYDHIVSHNSVVSEAGSPTDVGIELDTPVAGGCYAVLGNQVINYAFGINVLSNSAGSKILIRDNVGRDNTMAFGLSTGADGAENTVVGELLSIHTSDISASNILMLMHAEYPITILRAYFVPDDTLAASGTDYWDMRLRGVSAATPTNWLNASSLSTGFTKYTARQMDVQTTIANRMLNAGDSLELFAQKVGSPANVSGLIQVHYVELIG